MGEPRVWSAMAIGGQKKSAALIRMCGARIADSFSYGGPQRVTHSGWYSPFWKLVNRQLEVWATLAVAPPVITVTIGGCSKGPFRGTSL
jgi:hypothetical protein